MVGCVVLYDHDAVAVTSNFIARVSLTGDASPGFWTYLHSALYSGKLNYPAIKQTTGIQNLDAGAYFDILAPFPPPAEQRAIAAYLDRETARIDALVAKKRSLLERLAEYRTALITRTVTRGLDPSVAMKDSGVEWLGKVPAHWEVRPFRHVLREPLRYGANEAAEFNDPELPRFVRITDIDDRGRLRNETFRSLPRDVAAPYLLEAGDLLFARSGSVGRTFLYDDSWGACAYAGYLIRARVDPAVVTPEFVSHFTASQAYANWLRTAAIQATIENVSAERYARMAVPLPPLDEQRVIAAYLDRETARIDGLSSQVETAIERLQEYRTALITAAVTGKIDVRESAVVETTAAAGGAP